MAGTPRGRRGGRARGRILGMDPTDPMSQQKFHEMLTDWAVRNATRFGGIPAEQEAAGMEFGRRAVEADPMALAARHDLEAIVGDLQMRRTTGALPTPPTGPGLPPDWLAEMTAGGTDAASVMAAMRAQTGPGAHPQRGQRRIAEMQAQGLGRLVTGTGQVAAAEENVYGAAMGFLEYGTARGINRVAPGRGGVLGGGPPGLGGMPDIDLGAFQSAMGGPGGPNAQRSMSLLEQLVDLGRKSLDQEALTNNVLGTISGGGGAFGGGGGGGGGAVTGGLAGAAGERARGLLGPLEELAMVAGGGRAELAIAAAKVAQLYAYTRSREYEPIRQLEMGPGMSQAGDIGQVAQGQYFGPFRQGMTAPFAHMMGGETANDLRYEIQRQSIQAGLGLEGGQQIAQRLIRQGVGFGETRPGQAAEDILQTTRIALGPARAMGLTPEEAAETVGTMRTRGRMAVPEITHQFEDLGDVAERLGVGTKNLTESFREMLRAGFDPNQIRAPALGVAQATLGAGTNVGGFMAGVAGMGPTAQLAMLETLGLGPRSSSAADQQAALRNMSNPQTLLQGMSNLTQRTGGAGGFFTWQAMMQQVFGGQDVLGQAGMNQQQQFDLWNRMRTGQAGQQIQQLAGQIPREGTRPGERHLQDPQEYIGDAIKQLGQNMTPLEKAIQDLTLTINRFASRGNLDPFSMEKGGLIPGVVGAIGDFFGGMFAGHGGPPHHGGGAHPGGGGAGRPPRGGGGAGLLGPEGPEHILASVADFTQRTAGAGGFEQWRAMLHQVGGGADIAGLRGMSAQQQHELYQRMRHEGRGALAPEERRAPGFGLLGGAELPGAIAGARGREHPLLTEPAPWLMSLERFGVAGATPLGRAITPPMDFDQWRGMILQRGGPQATAEMGRLNPIEQLGLYRQTEERQRERAVLEGRWTALGRGGPDLMPGGLGQAQGALGQIVQRMESMAGGITARGGGQPDWALLGSGGPHGGVISETVARALGVAHGAVAGPGGLVGVPGQAALGPHAQQGVGVSLAQALGVPTVAASLGHAIESVSRPARGLAAGLGLGGEGGESARRGREEAQAFTTNLMRTLVPALAADMGEAFDSPAVRAAIAQSIIAALDFVTSELARRGGGTGGTVSGSVSAAAGAALATASGAVPAAAAAHGGAAGVLQGAGGRFRAFTGTGPSGGLSVFSGRASQGSATASPEVLAAYEQAAAATGVPLALLLAQTAHESSFNTGAVSSDGGYGLAQFTDPGVARKYLHVQSGEDWHKVALGQGTGGIGRVAQAQAAYMQDLYKQAGGDWQGALSMYNAGSATSTQGRAYGSEILSAAANLDLQLGGTLTVVNQQGQVVGHADIHRQRQQVNARLAKGTRTSGQDQGGHSTMRPT